MSKQQRVFIIKVVEMEYVIGRWEQESDVIAAFSTMELAEQWVENNFEEIDEEYRQLHAEIHELTIDLYVTDSNI